MNKKFKIAYWAMIAINAVICIVDIITARYFGAALVGITVLWLFVSYMQSNTICQQGILINDLLNQLKRDATLLYESDTREKIHHQEFAKMRERAQDAEKKLQQMIDDTPARGDNGRFKKRENNESKNH